MAVERMAVLRRLSEEQKQKRLSAWKNGVIEYAKELIINEDNENKIPCNYILIRKRYLNGAESWLQYSWGGCSLIYNEDIAKRLCNNTELKRTNFGKLKPNKDEEWLDVQSRALRQACVLIYEIVIDMTK